MPLFNNRTLSLVAVSVFSAVAIADVREGISQEEDAITYTRLYADAGGESHFQDMTVPLRLVEFAPPAQPILASDFAPASAYGFLRAPPGWFGEWHPSPTRQFLFYLGGESQLEVSDGEVRHFRAGDILLVEDTVGVGHVSRVVGNEDSWGVVVQLGSQEPL